MVEVTNPSFDNSKRKIGQLLMELTSLTEEQLEEALIYQKEEGGLLGKILVEKKLVLPHEIFRALCYQLNIPFADDLNPNEIDPELIKDIPINYAKSRQIIPLEVTETDDGEVLLVAVADPFDINTIEDLKVLTGRNVELVASPAVRVQDAINKVYEKSSSDVVEGIEDEFDETMDLEGPIDILEATENDAPVIKFVNSLLFRAVKEKASDIHVEPFEKELVVRFRVDGVLNDVVRQPKRAHAAISSRIKVMGQLDIAEKRLPQDGRIKIKIAGKDIDIRLSTVPTVFGERLVMRILEQSSTVLELEQLGFPAESQELIEEIVHRKFGIVLVTGPTGSGKSTTLSACLLKINSPDVNILTVEDPVEYQIQGVNQVQVNPKIELTFAKALRAFLRQNPDVIMVGEIRDGETAEIAITASLTGHLVLSTIHTNDASSAPTRLIDMGVEPYLVASSLLGVIAQRLMRKVCKQCREEYQPSNYEMEQLIGVDIPAETKFYRAIGCPQCGFSGYSGRTVIHELLVVNDDVRRLIVRKQDSDTIKKVALKNGMKSLRVDGVDKVIRGESTIDELMRVTHAEMD